MNASANLDADINIIKTSRGDSGVVQNSALGARDAARMKAGGYVLIVLLGVFITAVPYAIRANWSTLGPRWAQAAALFVPGANTAGDHVLTPAADVTITSQCSGAENIQIFSMLFATVFLMNWKRMQGWKSVLIYLGSLAALMLINLARIITIVVRAKETHSGLSSVLTLLVVLFLVWKVKWFRPADPVPVAVTKP
jgi:exosortase/archaeosortase family protein